MKFWAWLANVHPSLRLFCILNTYCSNFPFFKNQFLFFSQHHHLWFWPLFKNFLKPFLHPIEFVKCNNYFFISSHERYFWLKHFLLTTENILPVCFRAKPRFRYSKFKAEKPFILSTVFYVFLWFHTVFVLTYLIYLLIFKDLCLFCVCLSI